MQYSEEIVLNTKIVTIDGKICKMNAAITGSPLVGGKSAAIQYAQAAMPAIAERNAQHEWIIGVIVGRKKYIVTNEHSYCEYARRTTSRWTAEVAN